MITDDRFEPSRFSIEELTFMLDHLEKPPHAAMHKGVPVGVNPAAIENGLGTFYKFAQLEAYERDATWAGYDSIRDSIERFLLWHSRVERIRALGGPPNPSHYVWDGDRPFRYGIGADSGEMTRTEILDNGDRRAFGIDLRMPAGSTVLSANSEMPWVNGGGPNGVKVAPKDEMIEERTKTHGALKCSICGKAEEFNPASRASFTAARARFGRHLKSAKADVGRHRLLHRTLFQ